MSLEIAIQQNTAAINALIEILSKGGTPVVVQEDPQLMREVNLQPGAVNEVPKAKRTKKEAAPATAGEPQAGPASEQTAPSPAPGATDASETEAAAAPTKQITYTEAAAAVTKVAKTKGRDAAVEILAKFGAKTLGEVKASSYAKVIAECEAVL